MENSQDSSSVSSSADSQLISSSVESSSVSSSADVQEDAGGVAVVTAASPAREANSPTRAEAAEAEKGGDKTGTPVVGVADVADALTEEETSKLNEIQALKERQLKRQRELEEEELRRAEQRAERERQRLERARQREERRKQREQEHLATLTSKEDEEKKREQEKEEMLQQLRKETEMYKADRMRPDVPFPNRLLLTKEELFKGEGDESLPRIDLLLTHLLSEGRLELECCHYLVKRATKLLYAEPNMVEVEAPVYVVGDIHGQFYDLMALCEFVGGPPSADRKFLFLGDYVDRGCFSTEIVLYLYALKIRYPNSVYLLRGNHECRVITQHFNFYKECLYKYTEGIFNAFMTSFDSLALACLIKTTHGNLLGVHAGIGPTMRTLDHIREIMRYKEPPENGPFCDILWADPLNEDEAEEDKLDARETVKWQSVTFCPNGLRGCSYNFGHAAIRQFLRDNDLLSVVRGHSVQRDGAHEHTYFYPYRTTLKKAGLRAMKTVSEDKAMTDVQRESLEKRWPPTITVFSAPNYCDRYQNFGAVMEVHPDSYKLHQIEKWQPHPYYLPNFQNAIDFSMPYLTRMLVDFLSSLTTVLLRDESNKKLGDLVVADMAKQGKLDGYKQPLKPANIMSKYDLNLQKFESILASEGINEMRPAAADWKTLNKTYSSPHLLKMFKQNDMRDRQVGTLTSRNAFHRVASAKLPKMTEGAGDDTLKDYKFELQKFAKEIEQSSSSPTAERRSPPAAVRRSKLNERYAREKAAQRGRGAPTAMVSLESMKGRSSSGSASLEVAAKRGDPPKVSIAAGANAKPGSEEWKAKRRMSLVRSNSLGSMKKDDNQEAAKQDAGKSEASPGRGKPKGDPEFENDQRRGKKEKRPRLFGRKRDKHSKGKMSEESLAAVNKSPRVRAVSSIDSTGTRSPKEGAETKEGAVTSSGGEDSAESTGEGDGSGRGQPPALALPISDTASAKRSPEVFYRTEEERKTMLMFESLLRSGKKTPRVDENAATEGEAPADRELYKAESGSDESKVEAESPDRPEGNDATAEEKAPVAAPPKATMSVDMFRDIAGGGGDSVEKADKFYSNGERRTFAMLDQMIQGSSTRVSGTEGGQGRSPPTLTSSEGELGAAPAGTGGTGTGTPPTSSQEKRSMYKGEERRTFVLMDNLIKQNSGKSIVGPSDEARGTEADGGDDQPKRPASAALGMSKAKGGALDLSAIGRECNLPDKSASMIERPQTARGHRRKKNNRKGHGHTRRKSEDGGIRGTLSLELDDPSLPVEERLDGKAKPSKAKSEEKYVRPSNSGMESEQPGGGGDKTRKLSLTLPVKGKAVRANEHRWERQFFAMTNCSACQQMIVGGEDDLNGWRCLDCLSVCHSDCLAKVSASVCGGVSGGPRLMRAKQEGVDQTESLSLKQLDDEALEGLRELLSYQGGDYQMSAGPDGQHAAGGPNSQRSTGGPDSQRSTGGPDRGSGGTGDHPHPDADKKKYGKKKRKKRKMDVDSFEDIAEEIRTKKEKEQERARKEQEKKDRARKEQEKKERKEHEKRTKKEKRRTISHIFHRRQTVSTMERERSDSPPLEVDRRVTLSGGTKNGEAARPEGEKKQRKHAASEPNPLPPPANSAPHLGKEQPVAFHERQRDVGGTYRGSCKICGEGACRQYTRPDNPIAMGSCLLCGCKPAKHVNLGKANP